jgi:hypothetical protein
MEFSERVDYTRQQDLVLAQKYLQVQGLQQASDSLDNKANALLQVSGLIVALSSVVAIPGFVIDTPTTGVKIGIGVAFVAFAAMVGLSLLAALPNKLELPGTLDWHDLHQNYVFETHDGCFAHLLSDCVQSIEQIRAQNARKATLIRVSAGLFVVLLLGLFSTALLS